MTHTPHKLDEPEQVGEDEKVVMGTQWGGCVMSDGLPAIYIRVPDQTGPTLFVYAPTTLGALEETIAALKRTMS